MLLRLNKREWENCIKDFSIKPIKTDHKKIVSELKKLVIESVKGRIPDKRFGILFSGGVDSTTIAKICRDEKKDFICYTAALEEKGMKQAEDLTYAKKAAKKFGFRLKVKTICIKETEAYIKELLNILKEPNVVKVGVALPFYIAFEVAKKDNIDIMFSGLGSEEIFAGYERHFKSKDISKECFNGLLSMYERDLMRDIPVADHFGISLKTPFLDKNLIDYALKIPSKLKITKTHKKAILREAAEQLGLEEYAWRKKKAAQYGSKFDRAISKLAKRNGFKYKKDYLKSLI